MQGAKSWEGTHAEVLLQKFIFETKSESGSSTLNRGHEHHRSIRPFNARDERPRCLGGLQHGGGTGNDSSASTVQT
jgi:hypothetical protein